MRGFKLATDIAICEDAFAQMYSGWRGCVGVVIGLDMAILLARHGNEAAGVRRSIAER